MANVTKSNSKFIIFSVLLHVIILAIFIIGIQFSGTNYVLENSNQLQVINATVLGALPKPVKIESKVVVPEEKQITPAKNEPKLDPKTEPTIGPKQLTKKEEPPKIKELPKEALADKSSKQKAKDEIKKIETEKAISLADKKRLEKKEKEKIEKQLLADLKSQTENQKKLKHKEIAAEFAKEIKALTAKEAKLMAAEQKQAAAARTAQMQGVVDKYKALILQAIGQNWIVPPTVDKSLTAELLIRLAPGGLVLDVQLTKSSGDPTLDRSARAAVFKASPLPVPKQGEEFAQFKQFVLKVKPENLATNDAIIS